jgi:hypothetical protein
MAYIRYKRRPSTLNSFIKNSGILFAVVTLSATLANVANAEVLRRPDLIPEKTDPVETDYYHQAPPEMSTEASPAAIKLEDFGADPVYEESAYDADAQYAIYGNKRAVDIVHPLIELGQPLYGDGPLNKSYNVVGSKNLVSPQLYVYGDWRTVVASNKNGDNRLEQIVTRPSFEVDLKLTATERLHALLRPLEDNGQFTRYEFSGQNKGFEKETNFKPATFFFEGDLGAITAGVKDDYVKWDLPFTFGIIPLFYQNGIWLDDAFLGAAATIPSLNSKKLDISNMDFTFFASTNLASSGAIRKDNGALDKSGADIYGVTTFIETRAGYIEAGYGYTSDTRANKDFSYHNATASFTKRYGGFLSNSTRAIVNFGQNPLNGAERTADGYLLISENSLITSLPYTLIPYANLFYGRGKPQSLARAAAAGGALKNIGLNFETDGLTGFPKLEDTGNNTYGGALGLEYLFALNQQIVVELATVQVIGDKNSNDRIAKGDQYAVGARYQLPLNNAWIFRADAIAADLKNAPDLLGFRLELRRKF